MVLSKDPRNTIVKSMKCPKCNNIQTIRRKRNKNKKTGHRKPLWCIICQKRTLHIEGEEV